MPTSVTQATHTEELVAPLLDGAVSLPFTPTSRFERILLNTRRKLRGVLRSRLSIRLWNLRFFCSRISIALGAAVAICTTVTNRTTLAICTTLIDRSTFAISSAFCNLAASAK